jgi:serine/threonine protein kinase
MSVATVKRTIMLYCPKCRSTYEKGTQRFCSNDGGRLLPVAPNAGSSGSEGGVFTSILGKMPRKDERDAPPKAKDLITPKFEAPAKPEAPKAHAPISKIFETQRQIDHAPIAFDDDDSLLELDFDEPLDAPVRKAFQPVDAQGSVPEAPGALADPAEADVELLELEAESAPVADESAKVAPKLVNPYEIPSGTADIGDRSRRPVGRTALSWDHPHAIIGQIVKGRYLVKELIGEDEDSLEYRAADQIGDHRQTILRVYMDDEAYAAHFAEERISLAHLNHPNIAAFIDSGELPEGFRFVISEFVDGQSLATALRTSGQFNTKRTARIVRQISYALSEAHENGILHRNLTPDNIMLTVSDAGIEQVKLVNFEVSNSYWKESDIVYKSPEEISGDPPTFASEIYSLAIVGYEMLTAHLPFNALSERELLAAQQKGMTVLPTTLRIDVPQLADKILERALNFVAAERYPKARDFGDAFFNALTSVARWEEPLTEENVLEVVEAPGAEGKPREYVIVPPINPAIDNETPGNGDQHIGGNGSPNSAGETDAEDATAQPEDRMWVKRSPELPHSANWLWGALPILGVLIVLLSLWGIYKVLSQRVADLPATENTNSERTADGSQPLQTPTTQGILPGGEIDSPPVPRRLKAEPGTTRFVNLQESLKGELAKNFLGFEIFYPSEMKRTDSTTNFLDIATFADGIPVEQMIVTHYKSRGAMTLDRPNFKKLADKSNEQLRGYFKESYKTLGDGETAIQNGRWKGYEVKFMGVLPDGKTRVFGRRLWIPVQSPGTQNGFVITLLATSLATDIDSVDEVGTKGNLAVALENFEPEQGF